MREPFRVIPTLEKALQEHVLIQDATYMDKLASGIGEKHSDLAKAALDPRAVQLRVGFDGAFGRSLVSPRTLTAGFVTQLVMVEGIVTKASPIRPKVSRSVHYCPATKQFTTRTYRDATDPSGDPTGSVYPTRDDDGNPLETEFGLSTYRDHQTFTIQEMPEVRRTDNDSALHCTASQPCSYAPKKCLAGTLQGP